MSPLRPGASLLALNTAELDEALDRHHREAQALIDDGLAYIGDDGRIYYEDRGDE